MGKALTRVLFLLLLVAANADQGSTHSPSAIPQAKMQTFKVGDSFAVQATNGKVFVEVEVQQLPSKYLFIHTKLDSSSINTPVSLYIYKDSSSAPFASCVGEKIDSCYLSRQQIEANSKLTILLDSDARQFSLVLSTYWSDLEHLKPNSSNKFFFDKNDQTQLYHLELEDTEFYELRILMRPETVRSAFDKIRIYGKFGTGNAPSADDYDFKSIHLWEESEGVFLYGSQIEQKQLTLLITGEIETVYTLSCEIVEKSHHEIELNELVHEYLEPGEDFFYHAKFFSAENEKKLEFDEYTFTFSGYSGKLNVMFYTDEDRKKSLDIQPFEYLSDAQFIFNKRDIINNLKDGLYVYVHALQRKSVYSLKFEGRNHADAIELQEGVNEFLEIAPTETELVYFQNYAWQNDTRKGDVEFSVSMTNVIGDHEVAFYLCQSDVQNCIDINQYQEHTKLMEADVSTIGAKKTYRLMVQQQDYLKMNLVEKFVAVVMTVKDRTNSAEGSKNNSVVVVEYQKENRVQYLRENRPLETKIKQNQYKIYKYENQDPFIKEVKIFVNQIAGNVEVSSLRGEPSQKHPTGNLQTDSVISFTQNLTKEPIFLIIKGLQESIFSIQLSLIHKSDTSVSTITLSEDVNFELKIRPQGFEIVEVIPIYNRIILDFVASGSIVICPLENSKESYDCEQDFVPELLKKGEIDIPQFKERNKLFKIMNPTQDENIKVGLIFHSKDYAHCEQKHIGVLYYETIEADQISEDGTGFQNNCVSFPILNENSQISVEFSRIDIGEMHYAVSICSEIFASDSEASSEKLQISHNKIKHFCKDQPDKFLTLMFSPHKDEEQRNKKILPFKIKYLVEYSDEKSLTIPDGVAYNFQTKTTEGPVRTFYYDLLNKKETMIKLIQYQGFGRLSVYLVPTARKEEMTSSNNYDFSFDEGDSYFSNPTLTLTEQQLSSKECNECSFIIKVFSTGEIGSKVHFGIQVTQGHTQLQDHQPVDGFLTKDSLHYYSFTTTSSTGQQKGSSLIVEVTDNNKRCVNIFLSDYDYADDKNYITSEEGNQLVYEEAQPDTDYFISVLATDDCPYSITVSSTPLPIAKLRRGYNSYLNLKAGQRKYFMIEHIERRQFKILSILQKGETYFYMNKTTPKEMEALSKQKADAIELDSFEVESEYPNRIVLHENNSYLVENSFYLIAVVGLSDTEGYLFYGDSQTPLQIYQDSIVNDYLSSEGEVFKGQFYGEGKYEIQVMVLVGALDVTLVKNEEDKESENKKGKSQGFNEHYQEDEKIYTHSFELSSTGKSFFFNQPAMFTFTSAAKSTVYSFKFVQQVQEYSETIGDSSRTFDIQLGQPNYVYLEKSTNEHILKGTLNEDNEEIFFTIGVDQKEHLQKLEIKAFLVNTDGESEEHSITREMTRNVMKVQFGSVEYASGEHSVAYRLEVKTSYSLSLTVYQNHGVNLLPHDSDILVEGSKDFILYPQGSMLLDVFECSGKAEILYSKNKSNLDSIEFKSLNLVGMPSQPHAVKIINPGPIFMRLKGGKSFVRWLNMNSENDQGMGYLNYEAGSTHYEGSLLYLTVKWEPISKKRDTETVIRHVNYVIIVGNSSQIVRRAINCEDYQSSDLLYYNYQTENLNSAELSLDLEKLTIVDKYSENQNLFMNIVADVEIALPENASNEEINDHQHYRFVYSQQEIPLQVFREITVSQNDIYILALIGAGALLLFSLTVFLCVGTICPLIQRMRQGNMMVEENQDGRQFDVVPPSSDRNQVNNGGEHAMGTDEQMNS